MDKIRNRFGLQRVVLVGERGMLTGARIREDLDGIDGLRWITTRHHPQADCRRPGGANNVRRA